MQRDRIAAMKLVVMTSPAFFVEEDKILTDLFGNGMGQLHLCKPASSPLYYERLLSLLSEDYHSKIIVHDYFYLKEEYQLAGIHIDDESQSIPFGYKGKVGKTCTSIDKLKEYKRQADYIILRNIFDSQSEATEKSRFTMNILEKAKHDGLIDKKVYALGGMSIDNVKIAKQLGFGGVIIRGDLWNKFDIHSQSDYKELLLHFDKLKNAIS